MMEESIPLTEEEMLYLYLYLDSPFFKWLKGDEDE